MNNSFTSRTAQVFASALLTTVQSGDTFLSAVSEQPGQRFITGAAAAGILQPPWSIKDGLPVTPAGASSSMGKPKIVFLGSTVTKQSQLLDGWSSFSALDVANPFPEAGVVLGWRWFGHSTSAVFLQVFRPREGDEYELIGESHSGLTEENVANKLDGVHIRVRRGDVIGWTFSGTAAFGYDNSPHGAVRLAGENNSGGQHKVGGTWSFPRIDKRAYHVAAKFRADTLTLPTGAEGTLNSPAAQSTPSADGFGAAARCTIADLEVLFARWYV